jgi:2-oxoglutarate dehydrogenase E2 component (dihydrolipoamide succinyltransferase)
MIVEIKIPGAGESVTEAAIGNWLAQDGEIVEKDQEIAEVETDKATLPLIATESGKLKIIAKQGNKIQVGEVACTIDTDAVVPKSQKSNVSDKKENPASTSPAASTAEEHVQPTRPEPSPVVDLPPEAESESASVKITPLAKNIMDQNDIDIQAIIKGLKKITRNEVEQVLGDKSLQADLSSQAAKVEITRDVYRTPMSPLRRKLSKRLVSVKNETAMLTTFNEIDMTGVLEIRKKYQSVFQEKYKLKLGLMSFFIKASSQVLKQFPNVNSYIENDDIITPRYIDIAIAVQTDKGLMVPVLRNVNTLKLQEIESELAKMAEKARASKLSIDEMTGGTFTITNGGVFGSMLSTPILNPPQSAILGMHNIVERPVAINGKVEIRPIMYVALSYDHRIIDGRDSVSFLVKVKELIENPVYMLFEGSDPEKALLDL